MDNIEILVSSFLGTVLGIIVAAITITVYFKLKLNMLKKEYEAEQVALKAEMIQRVKQVNEMIRQYQQQTAQPNSNNDHLPGALFDFTIPAGQDTIKQSGGPEDNVIKFPPKPPK